MSTAFDEMELPDGWATDDPSLTAAGAPHELTGILRAKRNHWPHSVLVESFGLEGPKLMQALTSGLGQEEAAIKAGRPIHNPIFPSDY